MLVFDLLQHFGLLLLSFDPLVVAPFCLGASVPHLRLLLLLRVLDWNGLDEVLRLLHWRPIAWNWASSWTFIAFLLGRWLRLLSFFVFLVSGFLLQDLLQLYFLSLVNNGDDFGCLVDWQVIL